LKRRNPEARRNAPSRPPQIQ